MVSDMKIRYQHWVSSYNDRALLESLQKLFPTGLSRARSESSHHVARQSCPVSSRCLGVVPSPAAWGLSSLWPRRCRGRTADDLPALQHAASDTGQSEARSRHISQSESSPPAVHRYLQHCARTHSAHGLPLLQDSHCSEISKQRTFSANHFNWRHSLALRVIPCLELIYVIN